MTTNKRHAICAAGLAIAVLLGAAVVSTAYADTTGWGHIGIGVGEPGGGGSHYGAVLLVDRLALSYRKHGHSQSGLSGIFGSDGRSEVVRGWGILLGPGVRGRKFTAHAGIGFGVTERERWQVDANAVDPDDGSYETTTYSSMTLEAAVYRSIGNHFGVGLYGFGSYNPDFTSAGLQFSFLVGGNVR